MTHNFSYNPADLPPVKPGIPYPLADGRTNRMVQVGDITFDEVDESNVDEAYDNALAWIAWYEYLSNSQVEAA